MLRAEAFGTGETTLALGSDDSFPGLEDAVDVRLLESPLSERMWLTSSSRRAAKISPLSELWVLDVPDRARDRLTESLERRWMARICGRCGKGIGGTSGGRADEENVDSVGDAKEGGEQMGLELLSGKGALETPALNGSGRSVGGWIPCRGSSKDRSGSGLKSDGGGGGFDVDDDEATDDLRC